MGREIRVSTGRMNNDQETIKELLSRVNREISQLETTMTTLSSCWEGDAWVAFQKQVGDDLNYMKDVYQTLQLYMSALSNAQEQYLKSEKQCNENMRSIWI